MKYCLIAFLFCAFSLFAQPVHGPFTVLEQPVEDYLTPQIVQLSEDTVAVFYVDDEIVLMVKYVLDEQGAIGPPRIIGGGQYQSYRIEGTARSYEESGSSRAAVLVRSIEGSFEHYHCIYQAGDTFEQQYTGNVRVYYGEDGGRLTNSYSISVGSNGHWNITLIDEGSNNPLGEWNATPWYASIPSDTTEEFHAVYCSFDYEYCSSGPIYFACTQTVSGPLFVYEIANWEETVLLLPDSLAIHDPFGEPFHWIIDCPVAPFDLQQTRSGRIVSFSGREEFPYSHTDYVPQGVATFDTTGFCEITERPEIERDPDALAFHPDFGWALLLYNQNYLSVATVDTNGTLITPPGILFWHEGQTAIMDADIALTDDGKVVVLWNERDSWNEPAARLRVAWTDWETQLSTPDEPRQPLPESASLSAFPNPFNSDVRIEYSLPHSGDINLSVFNINGQLVQDLETSYIEAGTHSLTWQPNSTSGVYFLTLQTDNTTATQKILYLR